MSSGGRNPRLERPNRLIGEKPDRPAQETGQGKSINASGVVPGQHGAEEGQRIGVMLLANHIVGCDRRRSLVHNEVKKGIGTEFTGVFFSEPGRPIDRICGIAAALEEDSSVDWNFDAGVPTVDIQRPTFAHPAYPGPFDEPGNLVCVQRLTYADSGINTYGQGCGGQIAAINPQAGNEFFAVTLHPAAATIGALLLVSSGSASVPLTAPTPLAFPSSCSSRCSAGPTSERS